MNRLLTLLLGVFLILACGGVLKADLIGDQVDFARFFQGSAINQQQAIVGPGSEFTDAGSTTDIDGNSINIQFSGVSFNTGTPNQFLLFSDLDWVNNPGGIITGVDVTFGGNIQENGSTPLPGPFDASNVSFTDHSVSVDVGGLSFNDAFVNIELITDHTPVPEPTSIALWGIGLLGMAGFAYRRRKRAA